MSGAYSKSQAVWWAAATAAVNFVGTLIGLALVEKIGRRLLSLISLGGVILSLIVLALGFHVAALEYNPVTFHNNSSSPNPCNTATSCQTCTAFDSCGYCYSSSKNTTACLMVDSKDHSKSQGQKRYANVNSNNFNLCFLFYYTIIRWLVSRRYQRR